MVLRLSRRLRRVVGLRLDRRRFVLTLSVCGLNLFVLRLIRSGLRIILVVLRIRICVSRLVLRYLIRLGLIL